MNYTLLLTGTKFTTKERILKTLMEVYTYLWPKGFIKLTWNTIRSRGLLLARLLTASVNSSMVMALSHSVLALSEIWGIFYLV